MKKKGLIISTIVMVVVLVASLTTATYAWFTAESRASVTPINFSVSSASDVLIGVATTNKYIADATDNNFVSNDGIDYDVASNEWSGGTAGLGYSIDTGLDLSNFSKAVSTGVLDAGGNSVDSAWNDDHVVVKASGNNNVVSNSTIAAAIANGDGTSAGDYLDICFGVTPNADDLTAIQCVIGIKPSDNTTTLGMNAAITARYQIDNGTWNEKDIYDTAHYNTVKTTMTAPTVAVADITWAAGDAALIIDVVSAAQGQKLVRGTIYQIHLRLYINGNDSDCRDIALGVAASISIDFIATAPDRTAGA